MDRASATGESGDRGENRWTNFKALPYGKSACQMPVICPSNASLSWQVFYGVFTGISQAFHGHLIGISQA